MSAEGRERAGGSLRERLGCLLIAAPVVLLATGWLFLDVRTWLSAVGTLFLVCGALYRFVRPAGTPGRN